MDKSSPDDDEQNSPLPKEESEEMEVTVSTQLENLVVTREDATQTPARDMLPLGSVCKGEDCEGEESNGLFHTDTSAECLHETNDHNVPLKEEEKGMEATEAEETGVASAATLPVIFGCNTDCVDEDSEDSDRCLHSYTHIIPADHSH